ncbi:MAG: ATP synthase F1 subunit delta [Bacteroidetes bacterium]|nr:ATP synthase F1 subunit delta [Bacteroidota bacterium]
MPNPRLAARYAKSLLDLSVEQGQLEAVYADMQWLQAVCKNSREFVSMLRSPVISSDKKEKIVEAVAKGKVSALTTAFTRLLAVKHRESFLPEIATAFINQYKAHKKIYTIKLTTAVPVSDAVKTKIIEQIRNTSEMRDIELETSVNSNLIGGFVLQAGDKLVDASVAYDLKLVARQFDNNDFIYKIK